MTQQPDPLDRLASLEAAATPGPWIPEPKGEYSKPEDREPGWIKGPGGKMVVDYYGCGSHEAEWGAGNLELVIAMRNALPAVLRALRAAKELAHCASEAHYAVRGGIPEAFNAAQLVFGALGAIADLSAKEPQ